MAQSENFYTADILKHCAVIFLLFLTCSCSASYKNLNNSELYLADKIDVLTQDLSRLSDNTDPLESKQIAEKSITCSLQLADEYGIIRPPYFHNILVKTGIKKRGLCYHWADDLYKELSALDLKSFDIHLGISRKGNILREHNCVVITARGQDFKDGIILDSWRHSGLLYWAPVKTDKYPWEKL